MIHELKIIDGKLYLDEKRLFGETVVFCDKDDFIVQDDFTIDELKNFSAYIASRLNRRKITPNQARETMGLNPIQDKKGAETMISIIKFDLHALDKEIGSRPKCPSYLIMNDETLSMFKEAAYHENAGVMKLMVKTAKGLIYCGIPVATCNAVPYGFIDIKD